MPPTVDADVRRNRRQVYVEEIMNDLARGSGGVLAEAFDRKAAPPDSGPYQSPKKSVSPLEVRGRHPASVISGLGAPNANPWA